MSAPDDGSPTAIRAVSEAYAFIVLQWPALLGALALSGDDLRQTVRYVLAVLVVLLQVSAWRRVGTGFGNALLAAAMCVAATWYLHPTAWALLSMAGAVFFILVAQTASLRRARA
jgi:hypothetical protein